MEDYFDRIGNPLKVGDMVLILVPKTDASYRKGFIKDFRNPRWNYKDHFYCEVLVEYDDGRLYCNKKYYEQDKEDTLIFSSKPTKAWRSNSDIVKFKSEYILS